MKVDTRDLRAALHAGLARHRVPGASVALSIDGEVTAVAAGVINVTTGVELTPDTVMHIGSIAKVFNTTLLMQLVDSGAVELDEPILRYLPDLKLKDRETLERITVRMLVNHTSGIDGSWLPDHGHDEETIEKAIARCAELGQLFEPGAEWSYCNVAPVIAGYLVQRLRDRSWYQLVREQIFEPLDFQHAVATPEEALLHRASVGHYLDAAGTLTRTPFAFGPLSFAPAGSTLMLSAQDVVRFAQAHMASGTAASDRRILSASASAQMQQLSVSNQGKGYTYDLDMGLGWMLPGNGMLHHTGGGPGVLSVLYAHPQSGWAAAILTNAAHGWKLINELMRPWLAEFGLAPFGEKDVRPPSRPVAIDPGKYVGIYEDVLTRYRVSGARQDLMLSRQKKFIDCENVPPQENAAELLIPLGSDQFLLDSAAAEEHLPASRVVAFRNPRADGRMTHLGAGSLHRRVAYGARAQGNLHRGGA